MHALPSHSKNHLETRSRIGYVQRREAVRNTYARLGFRSGLEIHQQLRTAKKLFCKCPAGLYHSGHEYDAEIVRHMRPTLSELGEYDGTALMEFKTKKNILYRIKNESACTYDIDDTPPFPVNREALAIAMEVALLLKTNIVGELHITRKQYLDGSIPTGFQRTAIVGIEGEIPLRSKKVRIIQISLEEDSCREVSDVGHERIYTTDRLGIPLIETVTYPDMQTPDEAEEAAQYLRYLTRSTGKVNTGIGAAREDVNVSIAGGTRVEIKGVAHIKWIPELTHNEAFRQKALLEIRDILRKKIKGPKNWRVSHILVPEGLLHCPPDENPEHTPGVPVLVNLPELKGVLSFFTQPGHCFADELAGRLRVIACLTHSRITHSESLNPLVPEEDWSALQRLIQASEGDAQMLFWAEERDIKTALDAIQERCLLAFDGVPNETRKAFPDGTTVFERVLPGPDRMYPDTDSAPIPIDEKMIQAAKKSIPVDISEQVKAMAEWKIPADAVPTILKKALFPVLEAAVRDYQVHPVFAGTLLAHILKHIEGTTAPKRGWSDSRILDFFRFAHDHTLDMEIMKEMLPLAYLDPGKSPAEILKRLHYRRMSEKQILSRIGSLKKTFQKNRTSKSPLAEANWIMGRLRPLALGNIPMKSLRKAVEGAP